MTWWTYCILGMVTVVTYNALKRFLKGSIRNNFFLVIVCFILTVAICTGLFAAAASIFPESQTANQHTL